MILQILYLIQRDESNASSSADLIVYGAMLFSSISLISSALTFCTQRNIAKSTGRVSVQFDITSTQKGAINRKQNRNRVEELRREFGAILEIDKSLIRIGRSMSIVGGLRMTMNIYINHTKTIDMNIEGVFDENVQNGQIGTMVKEAWALHDIPVISNLNVERVESTQRRKGTIRLSVAPIVSDGADQKAHGTNIKMMTEIVGADIPQIEMVTETNGFPDPADTLGTPDVSCSAGEGQTMDREGFVGVTGN